MSTVSVVIPCWNDADLLRECLKSLAAQTVAPYEVIVVDNASTDATAEVAASFGARVVHEPVRGILKASSTGFEAATGEIIGRLDADSVPGPDWVERVSTLLSEDAPPAAVVSDGEFVGGTSAVRWFGRRVYLGGYFRAMAVLLGQPPLFGSNMAMHRSAWERVRPALDVSARAVHDDLYMSIRLPAEIRVIYEQDLAVTISARPFASPLSLGRRMFWGCNTLAEGLLRGGLLRLRNQRRALGRRAVLR